MGSDVASIIYYNINSPHFFNNRVEEMRVCLAADSSVAINPHLLNFIAAFWKNVYSEDDGVISEVLSPHFKRAAISNANL